MTKGGSIILRIYFALVSVITLVTMMFALGSLINSGLKTWIFPQADEFTYNYPCTTPMKPTGEKDEVARIDCERQQEYNVKNQIAQRQRDIAQNISMLIVALPLFGLHFRIVYHDWKEEKKSIV